MRIEGNYIVNRKSEDLLAPEDTLADSGSEYSSVESPVSDSIVTLLYVLFGLVLVGFLLRAADLQVFRGSRYAAIAAQRSHQMISLPPIRGIIYDSAGRRIAENEAALNVLVQSSEFNSTKMDKLALMAQISSQLSIPLDNLKQTFENGKSHASFLIDQDISKEVALQIQNLDWPGVYIIPDIKRRYNYATDMAHIVGHLSKISPEDIKNDDFYQITDRIGRAGLEAYYENELRGERQRLPLTHESWTAISNQTVGDDIYLTIDAEVQRQLSSILSNVIRSAGLTKATAIVENVHTGEIIAMVSLPTFNPNLFEQTDEQEQKDELSALLKDRLQPLFNRAIGGRYPPGSTIKPLYALAGLQEGIITPETSIYSAGAISVQSENDPNTSYVFRDWKVHGATNLKKAIAESVDVYFYALGGGYGNMQGLGVEKLARYLRMMNTDAVLGIDLPGEKSGVVPDKEWKLKNKNEQWFIGDTYNMSIGQGNLLVTPLWLTAYTAAIANGGRILKPYLVSHIAKGDSLRTTTEPVVIGVADFSAKNLKIVQDAMRATVTEGTAKLLADLPYPVAAKTGTAQVAKGQTNSLISVWGPFTDPDIAMTVVIEGTKESYGLVHRVAHDFLSWYFTTHPQKQ